MNDIPIITGAFHVPELSGDKPYLIGSRCSACAYICFPKKAVCVRCLGDDTMEDIRLGAHGTLETFAVMQVAPPGFVAPYIIGYIRLREGSLVFAPITGCEPRDDALEIGDEMELVIEKLTEDENGNSIIGWKFKPVKRRQP